MNKKIRTENGEITIPIQKGRRPAFANHLTEEQYNKFVHGYVEHAISHLSLKERANYELDKVIEVTSLDDGSMSIKYENGTCYKFQ